MSRLQYVGLLAVFGAAAFFGGLVGTFRPTLATAQPPVVTIQDVVTVPDEGLRFVTPGGRTVAVLGLEGGNAAMSLLDEREQPSVILRAAAGGQVFVEAGRVSVVRGQNVASLGASDAGVLLEGRATNTSGRFLVSTAGAQFDLTSPTGGPGLTLQTAANGSRVEGKGPQGAAGFRLRSQEGPGELLLSGPDSTFSASGLGSAKITVSGEETWKAP